jgi:hypothetical protein
MTDIPQGWIRERTSIEAILADWSCRRVEHDWWTPPCSAWCREWEAFTRTIRDGDDLYHFSESTTLFPAEDYRDEGYVILRGGVQVRNIFWVGRRSDYSVDATHNSTNAPW